MTDYDRIAKIIAYLGANYRQQPTLERLAKIAGLSDFHFHRLFKRWAGTTPKSFLQYLTATHAKELLADSRDLLSASHEVGLSGPGRLHDLIVSIEAMSPGEYKQGGQGVEIRYGIHPSPFGDALIAVTKRGVCHLAFTDGETEPAMRELRERWPNAELRMDQKSTAMAVRAIFGGRKRGKIPVVLMGSDFQLKVWEALLKIPEGRLASYSDIARLAGAPGASRAAGTAIARNSVALLIPCHRVIRESGQFGAYRWGLERKQALLGWEISKCQRQV